MEVFFASKKRISLVSSTIAMNRLTLLISNERFYLLKVYSSRHWLEPMKKFHSTACSVASYGTFVSRTLPYTAYGLFAVVVVVVVVVVVYGIPLYRFFPQQFSDSFVCRSNERTQIRKITVFSPCLCCSNRKQVQLNMFSLSSLISRIRKWVVRCCLQYPISFSPFN